MTVEVEMRMRIDGLDWDEMKRACEGGDTSRGTETQNTETRIEDRRWNAA